jgi:hypothetical protein
MPLPTACFFHSGLVNIHTADQAIGWACVLACATDSSAGWFDVAREPPLTPSHVHGNNNAIMECGFAGVVVFIVFTAVSTVDAQVC